MDWSTLDWTPIVMGLLTLLLGMGLVRDRLKSRTQKERDGFDLDKLQGDIQQQIVTTYGTVITDLSREVSALRVKYTMLDARYKDQGTSLGAAHSQITELSERQDQYEGYINDVWISIQLEEIDVVQRIAERIKTKRPGMKVE